MSHHECACLYCDGHEDEIATLQARLAAAEKVVEAVREDDGGGRYASRALCEYDALRAKEEK
jgi:hypothetical protein